MSTTAPSNGAIERLESTEWLTSWSEKMRPLVTRLVGDGTRRDALTGRWLGHPVHPASVIVALSCWFGATALDLIGGRRSRHAARRLMGLGVLTAIPTTATGAAD